MARNTDLTAANAAIQERYQERAQLVLKEVWEAWTRDRPAKLRALQTAAGYSSRSVPGTIYRLVQELVNEGFMQAISTGTGQGKLAFERPYHLYTRGPRIGGIDKRTGRVLRVIDETRGWT